MPGPRGAFSPREEVVRPADPAVRRANLRRVGKLFRAYWGKLGTVAGLIVLSSALAVVSPFLLRAILNDAFDTKTHPPSVHVGLLSALVGGMIAISIISSAIGVIQSYISTEVGQSVMHEIGRAHV